MGEWRAGIKGKPAWELVIKFFRKSADLLRGEIQLAQFRFDLAAVIADRRIGEADHFSDLQLGWLIRIEEAMPQDAPQPLGSPRVRADQQAEATEKLRRRATRFSLLLFAQGDLHRARSR